jgi:hypothetical protein
MVRIGADQIGGDVTNRSFKAMTNRGVQIIKEAQAWSSLFSGKRKRRKKKKEMASGVPLDLWRTSCLIVFNIKRHGFSSSPSYPLHLLNIQYPSRAAVSGVRGGDNK